MRRWLCLCLLLGLSGALWAQQNSPQSSPAPYTPPPFPGDAESPSTPGQGSAEPASSTPATGDSAKKARVPNLAPPRSDRVQADDLGSDLGQSSSKDTQVDLSAPEDDAKTHPQSSAAVAEAKAELSGGITEFRTWDPHKAAKSVEVGDFYFRRKNYRAAEDRYREALRYKENDAVATLRLAVCMEKLGELDDSRAEYESYLKILPHGPESGQAQKAIDRLNTQAAGTKPPQ